MPPIVASLRWHLTLRKCSRNCRLASASPPSPPSSLLTTHQKGVDLPKRNHNSGQFQTFTGDVGAARALGLATTGALVGFAALPLPDVDVIATDVFVIDLEKGCLQ